MLGHTLKLVRLYNHTSAEYAAEHVNISLKRLIQIERGKRKIALSMLEKFSQLYQMPIYQILLLNDKKEHLQASDSEVCEDIEIFYVTKQDEPEEMVKRKAFRWQDVK